MKCLSGFPPHLCENRLIAIQLSGGSVMGKISLPFSLPRFLRLDIFGDETATNLYIKIWGAFSRPSCILRE